MAMTLIHRGRGGSVTRAAEVTRIAAAALLCLTLGLAGCASKKAQGLGGEGSGSPVGGEGLKSQSTIEDYSKNGTIGGGEGGPLSDIHFGYNDYTVQPQDSSVLRTNATWLQDHPNRNVQVEGKCDERGSEEYNIALGAKRAHSAKGYLVSLRRPPQSNS